MIRSRGGALGELLARHAGEGEVGDDPVEAAPVEGRERLAGVARINDVRIAEADRLFRWPAGRRPDDHPGLSALWL